MSIHSLAGKPAPPEMLVDTAQLEREFSEIQPEISDPNQLVSFGTSGHRGTTANGSFTEVHIVAITQAICEFRRKQSITGPVFMGKDTHALSRCTERVALEVLAANETEVFLQEDDGATPTPVVSRAILVHNRGPIKRQFRDFGDAIANQRKDGLADGIIITPSHNPPQDGGFKYNPPNGGPADTDVTGWIQDRANELMRQQNKGVRRTPFERALKASTTHAIDMITPFVEDLGAVIDMEAIRGSDLKLGVDPLGGASVAYWKPIAERFGLNLTVVNDKIDPTFGFMTVDHDGKIRMDCSSPYAMAGLVGLKEGFDVAWGCDPDADRHGIVTPSSGLLNPNHYLAVAIRYLLTHRPDWPGTAVVGKTLVSSSLIDRVVGNLDRRLMEVPVGFKWFAPGLFDGSCCFGGEESAGASFLRRDGTVWTTDKDGLILGLLAAEITARTGRDPGEHYRELTGNFGTPHYRRIDAPATPEQKSKLKKLSPESVTAVTLAGRPDDARPGEQRRDRRIESHHPERMVRRASVRDGEHLQVIRREFQERAALGRDPGGSTRVGGSLAVTQ